MTAKNGEPCKKCGTSEWYTDGKCKFCKRKRERERYIDPERKRELMRQWIARNPERKREHSRRWAAKNRERMTQRSRQWEKDNPDKVKEKDRRQYEKNAEQIKARSRNWKKANPDKANAQTHLYRAKKNKGGGSYTVGEWKALCERYDNRCIACGRGDVKLTADHVLPISKGGSSDISNIQPLCQSCNSKKFDRYIDYRNKPVAPYWIQRKLF